MADSKTLHDVFVDEMKDSYDHEKQLVKALRKMAGAASHPDLKEAFTSHLAETQEQVTMLEEVFAMLDLKPRGKHCAGIAGIIEEGNEAIEEMDKSPLLDAALIGGGKRAEHYEIASYTASIAMATELGLTDVAEKLQAILDQEVVCDGKLDELAAKLLPLANAANDDADDDDSFNSASSRGKPAARKRATSTR